MDLNDSPAREFDSYSLNEQILERLELLNYEQEFVPLNNHYKPISRYYFVKQTNSGEQFYLFSNLAVWLMKKCGENGIDYITEFDDPNSTISQILNVLKTENIPVDYSISSIKRGSGPGCVHILNELSILALKKANYSFSRFEVIEDDQQENDEGDENDVGESAEITAEQFDDDESASVIDEDVGEATQFDTIFDEGSLLKTDSNAEKPLDYLISKTTNIPQFRAEIERATPQLKITIRADSKDWRSHIDQLSKQLQQMKINYNNVKPFILDTQNEIIESIQRIDARERHINQQLNSLLSDYRIIQDRIAEKNEQYREASGGINSRTEKLHNLSDEVEQLKMQIEEQAIRNNDSAPIVKIKQAINKLENQIIAMSIQTAIIEQQLFSRKIRSLNYTTDFINDF